MPASRRRLLSDGEQACRPSLPLLDRSAAVERAAAYVALAAMRAITHPEGKKTKSLRRRRQTCAAAVAFASLPLFLGWWFRARGRPCRRRRPARRSAVLAGVAQREALGDLGVDRALLQQLQDVAEVAAQVGAVAVALARTRPEVEELCPASVGQHVPCQQAGEQLEDRHAWVAGDVARRGGPVGHQRSAAGEHAPRVGDTGAADVVEDGGDAVRRQLAHARGHVLVAVVDGDRPRSRTRSCAEGPAVPITRMPAWRAS